MAIIAVSAGAVQAQDPVEMLYAPRTDWMKSGETTLNISSFVYNDLNESGSWDIGDRTMAAVAVALARENEGLAVSRTNGNGFANFAASATHEDAVISQPGDYTFQVITPPGWRVTSGNDIQTGRAVLIAGSRSGIGFEDMMRPVGLTRQKFISGEFGRQAPGRITLKRDGGEYLSADIKPKETFTFTVPRGSYELSDGSVSRRIEVGDNPVFVGHFGEREAPEGGQRVAAFDDLTDIGLHKVPNGYQGVDWFNLNAMRRDFFSRSQGYVNGATSGSYIAYTSSGHPAEITSDRPFSFVSMQITGAWSNAEGEIAKIEMWSGEKKVLTDQLTVSVLGPVQYSPEIGGITRVRISSTYYWQLVIDDIVISH